MDVITANPKTAGVARWIFFALWGHRCKAGDAAATKYVTRVFDRVVVQPRDAREASDVFYKQRRGDALLTYENEAVFTNLVVPPTERLPFIVPDNNVRVRWLGDGASCACIGSCVCQLHLPAATWAQCRRRRRPALPSGLALGPAAPLSWPCCHT